MQNKQVKAHIKKYLPYYGKIGTKNRYTGVKAKAWGITSDYVRMRDFLKYRRCVSSGTPIANWKDHDAGHYYSMGGHGAYLGFHHLNIHLQGANENRQGSAHSGAYFRDELVRRYGEELITELTQAKNTTVKADDWYFIEKIKEMYGRFQELKKEHPNADYPRYLD